MSTLQGRLQNLDYQNWVKAGICLLYTKEGLEDFVSTECKQLHQNVLNHTRSLVPTPGHLICGINITRQRLINTCGHPYCQGFLSAVIQEGIDPNHPFIPRPGNLANTNVGLWHSEPYQLAKLFMNAGQLPTDKDPSETDLSGIINFLHHCKVPRNHITNPLFTDKVRQARNAVMHTPDMKVTEPDFKAYSQSMINLLNDPNISSSPRAKDAVAQIQTVTNATDFQITLQDEGKVRMDSLAAKLQTLTDEINSKLAEVEDCGVREREQIRLEIEQCKKEMTEVSSVFKTVEDKMGNQLRKLETLLAKTIGDHKDLEIQQEAYQTQTNEAIANVKLQQKQTGQAVGNLQVQQATANEEIDNLKTQQKQIGQAVGNLQVQQETANEEIDNLKTQQRQTGQVVGNLQVQQATANEEIDNLKTQQRQTDQRIDDLQNKAGQTWIPSDED